MNLRVEAVDASVTHALRRRVLRSDLPPGATGTMPGDGPDSVHVAAFDGEVVVGAAAVLPALCPELAAVSPAFQLRGMAVAPEAQGTGIGSLVFAQVLDEVRARGAQLLWCNARLTATAFYLRHGMQPVGPEFVSVDTALPHVVMWRELSPLPASSR